MPVPPATHLTKKPIRAPNFRPFDVTDYPVERFERKPNRKIGYSRALFKSFSQTEADEEPINIDDFDVQEQINLMRRFELQKETVPVTIDELFHDFAVAVQSHASVHIEKVEEAEVVVEEPKPVQPEVFTDYDNPTALRRRIATLLMQLDEKENKLRELAETKTFLDEKYWRRAQCGVCYEKEKKEMLPCGHVVCDECSKQEKCSYCSTQVDKRLVIYL